jgi:hypothetical protein
MTATVTRGSRGEQDRLAGASLCSPISMTEWRCRVAGLLLVRDEMGTSHREPSARQGGNDTAFIDGRERSSVPNCLTK